MADQEGYFPALLTNTIPLGGMEVSGNFRIFKDFKIYFSGDGRGRGGWDSFKGRF
jgi:hypothetical protein